MNSSSQATPRRGERKTRALTVLILSVALADVLLVWAAKREPASAPGEDPVKPSPTAATRTDIAAAQAASSSEAKSTPETPPPAETPTPKPGPSRPRLSAGVEDIEKLAKAKVDAKVVEAFIEHSPVAYYLSPEEIVYLSDLGVSSETVASLIRHGAKLRGQAAQDWREREQQEARAAASAPAAVPAPAQHTARATAGYAPKPPPVAVTYPAYPSYSYTHTYPVSSSVIYFPSYGYRSCLPYGGYGYRRYGWPHSRLYGSYWHPRWSFGFSFGYGPRSRGGWRCW
jgi:hypothetical protein